jgi:hypothetical protein
MVYVIVASILRSENEMCAANLIIFFGRSSEMSRKYSNRLISQKPFQIKTSGDFIEIIKSF